MLNTLTAALAKYEPAETTQLVVEKIDKRYQLTPPDGGLVVRVCGKIMGGYDEPESHYQQIFQTALSRDNLWITKDEQASLVAGEFPQRLANRIAQFHLVDNTRGEAPLWKKAEVLSSRFAISGSKSTLPNFFPAVSLFFSA